MLKSFPFFLSFLLLKQRKGDDGGRRQSQIIIPICPDLDFFYSIGRLIFQEDQNRGKPNWEHLNDELHVLITVEDSENRANMKLQRAVDEVKKLLTVVCVLKKNGHFLSFQNRAEMLFVWTALVWQKWTCEPKAFFSQLKMISHWYFLTFQFLSPV